MELDIGYNNISCFQDESSVVSIKWKVQYLDDVVFKKFPNLRKLYCEQLDLESLDPIKYCTKLEKLVCSFNKIKSLNPISSFLNLTKLDCRFNNITSLEPLRYCINLEELDCYRNEITSLEPLRNCRNLRKIDFSCNNVLSLEPLRNCVNLQELYFRYNKITTLEPISNCVNLAKLDCFGNQITTLNPLIYLQNINYIFYNENPLEVPSVQITRMLDRISESNFSQYSINNFSQYSINNFSQYSINSVPINNKSQCIPNSIQRTVCDSIQNLLRDEKPVFTLNDIIDSELDQITKQTITEYCQDKSIHSFYLITYQELLSYIWQRIQKSEHKLELLKKMDQQISECKLQFDVQDLTDQCITDQITLKQGSERFSHILSVLVGFYDDIKIEISDKKRSSAIILSVSNKLFYVMLMDK